MILESLKTFNFRNLVNTSLDFGGSVNYIVGQNGQGKTNLLEAIYVLGVTKSFRTSKFEEVVCWGEKSLSVFGKFNDGTSGIELGVLYENDTKSYYVNSDKTKAAMDFLGKFLVVAFNPNDLMLVKGSPGLRRKFLDKHSVDVDHSLVRHLSNYSRALRNKNKLLKEGGCSQKSLDPWNQIIAVESARIISSRREFVSLLRDKVSDLYRRFAPEREQLTIKLKESIDFATGDVSEGVALEKLRSQFDKEVRYRTSVIGPHMDDVLIYISGREARSFASQGQCRSIVLALKLGVIELIEERVGRSPAVLLDDVDSELDSKRAEAFFRLIFGQTRQVFITGVEVNPFLRDKTIDLKEIHSGSLVTN